MCYVLVTQEEDKTFLELAIMYKEEGNEWMKKKTAKETREAFNCYAVGIGHGDRALAEEGADVAEIYPIMSTLYSNRAICSLSLKNFRAAYVDSCKSLQFNSGNVKAHYRKCKALLGSKRYEDCLLACGEAMRIDPSNEEVLKMREQCTVEIARKERVAAARRADRVALCSRLAGSWEVAAASGASLGCPRSSHPQQFEGQIFPTRQPAVALDEAGKEVEVIADCWPLLCLYPQYNQIDVLRAVSADELLVVLLSQMFAEPGDNQMAPWDLYKEYYLSKLVVYVPIGHNEACNDLATWSDRMCSRILGETDKKADKAATAMPAGPLRWAEAHMGCTVGQILAAPGHVLDGGLITFTIFVR